MASQQFDKMLSEATGKQGTHRPDGLGVYLGSAADVAAFYYGRLLMLRDERKKRATERRYAKEGGVDRLTLQELQLNDELLSLADTHAMRSDLISSHFLKSQYAAVQQLGQRLRDRLKQRAAELGSNPAREHPVGHKESD